MRHFSPEEQERLVAVETKTRVQERVSTLFLAGVIVVGTIAALNAIATLLGRWLAQA